MVRMPIQRYRSIEEVPPPDALDPLNIEVMERASAYFAYPPRILPPLFPPGLYKYRSIEEADKAKEQAIIKRARLLRNG